MGFEGVARLAVQSSLQGGARPVAARRLKREFFLGGFGGLRSFGMQGDRKEALPIHPREWEGDKKGGIWVRVSSWSLSAPDRRGAGGGDRSLRDGFASRGAGVCRPFGAFGLLFRSRPGSYDPGYCMPPLCGSGHGLRDTSAS